MVTHLAECSQDILISLNLSNTFRWGHLLSSRIPLLLLLKGTFKLLGGPIKEEAFWGTDWGRFKVIIWIVIQHDVQLLKLLNHAAHHNKGVAIFCLKSNAHTHEHRLMCRNIIVFNSMSQYMHMLCPMCISKLNAMTL